MQFVEPKPKKCGLLPTPVPLPLIQTHEVQKFHGVFNGVSVVITEADDMKKIVSMGYFGKANFSRSYPQFEQKKTEIIRRRQFEHRKNLKVQHKPAKKVLVLPDSDDEHNEEYFHNLQPTFEMDCSGVKENVYLGLEEAFFLQQAVGCLDISQSGKILNVAESWEKFADTDPHFVQNYTVYHYYRGKNWVVKPGIKFGGDYLLYKDGPPFYHASYLVIIDVLDSKMKRINRFLRRSMDSTPLMGLNRLCETAGKKLLICQVIWPDDDTMVKFDNLSNISIKEVLIDRWSARKERQTENLKQL